MKQKKVFLALFVFGAGLGRAQESIPHAEAGVSFAFVDFHPGASSFQQFGGSATFIYNFNRFLGGVADVGAHNNPSSANFNLSVLTYLFGPRVSFRHSRFTPYVQTLFGGARQWNSFVDSVTGPAPASSGFAAALGGGLDIQVSPHILIKPLQVDYLKTNFTDPLSTVSTQNNVRYLAGMVFRFGSK